ncbi:YybH family protein [Paraflavitalea pollutisoli]|uniref:YybH family protein n=1 Tax=Paraflavitalea pollutisoli TaxID=3034143 RepID=UPI0023ECF21C|nr:nuclear transport factor 2 family protein [Paraflavitalea sp. H1-2-19X]
MLDTKKLEQAFGQGARSRKAEAAHRGFAGAVAALETFYYAFNNRDIDAMHDVWDEVDQIQLNNPVGGIIRGREEVMALYTRIFYGHARVWVELSDIFYYASEEMVVFAGTEHGAFTREGITIPLKIRTTRLFTYRDHHPHQWVQVHHHGSIDDADVLQRYQAAVL